MIWVVKLGGSLCNDARLATWLDMLVDCGKGQVVIVPGGGPYADAIRIQQQRWQFSDEIAHRMALLAMDQFALQLKGMNPLLVVAPTHAAIASAWSNNQVALWLPSAMVSSAAEIAATWDTTSDSLAAWLARTLQAGRLVLVKSCMIPLHATIDELVRSEIIDREFTNMTRAAPFRIQIVSVSDIDQVRRDLTHFQSTN